MFYLDPLMLALIAGSIAMFLSETNVFAKRYSR